MRTEIIALLLVLAAVVGIPAAVVAYDRTVPPSDFTLVGRTPLHGNWSQREIHVRQGEQVRIRLTSEDVTHGFYIPDLNVNAGQISPGQFKLVEFTANTKGTFTFYCNNLCSHEHGAMVGKLVVE
jgi:cytochrome c oxidase subunit 2